jgi:hypothetical protein
LSCRTAIPGKSAVIWPQGRKGARAQGRKVRLVQTGLERQSYEGKGINCVTPKDHRINRIKSQETGFRSRSSCDPVKTLLILFIRG